MKVIVCFFSLVILIFGLYLGFLFGGYRLGDFLGADYNDIDKENVNYIVLLSDTSNFEIKEQGDQWIFSNYFDLVVDQSKIQRLFSYLSLDPSKLKKISKKFWHEKNRKTEDLEFKLVFKDGNKTLVTILFFTPSSSIDGYALLRANEDFFILPSKTFPYPYTLEEDDWIDKNLLHFSVKDIHSIEFQDILITREKGNLILDGFKKNNIMTDKIEKLAEKIANFNIKGVSPMSDRPFGEERILTIWIGLDKKPVQYYSIYRNEELDYDLLMTNKYKCQFKINREKTNYLKGIDKNNLLKDKYHDKS